MGRGGSAVSELIARLRSSDLDKDFETLGLDFETLFSEDPDMSPVLLRSR
jgi:hypothetical protein